ncbi:putative ubiquitin [Besnoitia besnoiti]|uniref:Putative ubiquitin n=1 Tax=Besnoitia besnoiti TaxID=94643 RepID=A0A2A9MJR8_BESBE|nr:putative ubiquitin [Besnoitia besnoiti]PFH38159.1 putative ubiquitin [Besnoitia besnoiti]
MAACTVVVTDYTGGRQGSGKDNLVLDDVNIAMTVGELKQKIVEQRGGLDASRVLLYMGKILMEDHKNVSTYNRSKRAKLQLELYDLLEIQVKIKTLQHFGSGGCVMVPLWAICCRQTFVVEVPDHETVGYLRRRVCEELADPEKYPLENIKIAFRRKMLMDDLEDLRSLGIKEGSTVTLFVKLCYFNKRKAAEDAAKMHGAAREQAAQGQEEEAAEGHEEEVAAEGKEERDGEKAAAEGGVPEEEAHGEEAGGEA